MGNLIDSSWHSKESECRMPHESGAVASGNKSISKKAATAMVQTARGLGFLRAYHFLRSHLVKQQVAVIAYHRIDWADNCPWSLTPITPPEFDREMKYLRRNYNIISADELSTALSDLNSLPPNTAVVTIDDGYKDVYVNAYPILKKYNIPATVFLATGHIGTGKLFWWDKVGYIIWKTGLDTLDLGELGIYHLNSTGTRLQVAKIIEKKLKLMPDEQKNESINTLVKLSRVDIPSNFGSELIMSWDEIKEMNRNGIKFGAHTVNHPILARLPLEAARKEIIDSKKHIENELGQEIVTFCYPNGEPNDLNDDIEKILENSGFKCAVTTVPAAFVSQGTQPYRLPRIPGTSSLDNFDLLMSGLYLDLSAARHCFTK
jgi:peptidoglycan/xylan/chitin deacetylase (PgdA/CDA1 family)